MATGEGGAGGQATLERAPRATRCSAAGPSVSTPRRGRSSSTTARCCEGDAIVIATGAQPRPLPGTEDLGQRDGLFTLRTLDDSLALRAAVTAVDAARVVVIGAGFIGAEVASTCAGLGCRVTVLEALDIPLCNVLGPMIGSHFAGLHGAHDVELRTGVDVRGIRRADADDAAATAGSGGPRRLVVELDGGEIFPADVVVVGIGVSPTTDWLAGSGLTIDNGVVCDDRLFAADGIVAAGDVARWNWRHDGGEEQIRIEHWQVAAEAGVAAGRSLLAGRADAPSFTPVPYFWSDQYGIRLQVLGNPGGDDDVHIVDGSLSEGKFVALFGGRPAAGRHGYRQAAAADELPAAAGGGQQLGRRAGACSDVRLRLFTDCAFQHQRQMTLQRGEVGHLESAAGGAQKGPEGPSAR